jgi:hypothetical protein
LECNSRAERITQDREEGNQERDHRQEACCCIAPRAIGSARTEFLVGTDAAQSYNGLSPDCLSFFTFAKNDCTSSML